MDLTTREMFKRVLKKALDTEAYVERLRRRLEAEMSKVGCRDLKIVFSELDWINRGYVCKSDVKRVVDQFTDHLSQATVTQRSHPDSLEMEAVFRRFTKDKQNGRVSVLEFMEEVKPKQEN